MSLMSNQFKDVTKKAAVLNCGFGLKGQASSSKLFMFKGKWSAKLDDIHNF